MKRLNFKEPIEVQATSLDGDIILNRTDTWINPSHLNMWLKEQLNEFEAHVFVSQGNVKLDFIQSY